MSTTRDTVLAVMAETFPACPPEALPDLAAGQDPWDSLGHLMLMMALEARFGRPIPADRFAEMITIEAITAHFDA